MHRKRPDPELPLPLQGQGSFTSRSSFLRSALLLILRSADIVCSEPPGWLSKRQVRLRWPGLFRLWRLFARLSLILGSGIGNGTKKRNTVTHT
jgi:hypothetical protein